VIEALYQELQDVEAEHGDLDVTVLNLTSTVTSLMASVAGGCGAAGGGGGHLQATTRWNLTDASKLKRRQ
jgi:hypothetical protein